MKEGKKILFDPINPKIRVDGSNFRLAQGGAVCL
jgi:hypothetical protein